VGQVQSSSTPGADLFSRAAEHAGQFAQQGAFFQRLITSLGSGGRSAGLFRPHAHTHRRAASGSIWRSRGRISQPFIPSSEVSSRWLHALVGRARSVRRWPLPRRGSRAGQLVGDQGPGGVVASARDRCPVLPRSWAAWGHGCGTRCVGQVDAKRWNRAPGCVQPDPPRVLHHDGRQMRGPARCAFCFESEASPAGSARKIASSLSRESPPMVDDGK